MRNGRRTIIYDTCLLQAEVLPLDLRTTYAYDRYGNRTSMQNPLGYVWTTSYDSEGFPTGTTAPLGNQAAVVYDAGRQKVTDGVERGR